MCKCSGVYIVRLWLGRHKGNIKQKIMHFCNNPKLVLLYSQAVLNETEDEAIKSAL